MTDLPKEKAANPILKRLPIIVIGVVAVLGAYFLKDK